MPLGWPRAGSVARVVVKAQVKVGGRGKAGGVKLADGRGRGQRPGHRHPRHGHQGPHRPQGHDHRGRRHRRGVLLLLPARPGQPHVPVHRQRRPAAWRSSRSPRRTRRRWPRSAIDAERASTRRRRARSSRPRSSRPRSPTGGRRSRSSSGRPSSPRTPRWSRSTRWPRPPTAGCSPSTARSPSTRTPTSATRTTRRWWTPRTPDPLEQRAKEKDLNYVKLDGEVGIIGNGAGLVMSTLDVVAYAGEEHGGVQAGQLPRHRRWRHRRGDGERPGDRARPTRRSRACSSTSSAASPPATRSPTASCRRWRCWPSAASRSTSRSSCRLDGNNAEEGRAILDDAEQPAAWSGSTRWTAPPHRAAELAAARGLTMAIFLDQGLARSSSRA